MSRQHKNMAATAITIAVVVAVGGAWVGDLLVPARYPAESAYKVPGLTVQPVDLAALQRSWPAGLDAPAARVRLVSYMGKVERGAVVLPAAAAGARPAAVAMPEVDLGTRLAQSDAARGQNTAKVCASCHTVEPNGANRVGPNLWGVVGRPVAGHGGFAYSPAMDAQQGAWTYERLDAYLASPARAVPGTKMSFGGVRNPVDRANLLAYLGSLNPARPPFPAPAPAPAPAKAETH